MIETNPPAETPEESKLKFVAVEYHVKRGADNVAIAVSRSMARRIARALNLYDHPTSRFVRDPGTRKV